MRPFEIRMFSEQTLYEVLIASSVLAYVSVILNIFVLIVLCRKNILSPATILMQGLAVSDGLTSFCASGLEPLFLNSYKPVVFILQTDLYQLKYPYCALYVHFHYLSDDFHLVSLMLTTSIGIQKCVALRFPIWTKIHLTNRKTIIVTVICFVISLSVNIPRHFGIEFYPGGHHLFPASECMVEAGSLISYALLGHVIVSVVFVVVLCFFLTFSTGYIVYRLITNTFKGRQTENKKQERRSIVMVILLLVVFFISEIPRICLNAFTFSDVIWMITTNKWETTDLITYIMDERFRLSAYIQISTNLSFEEAIFMVEAMRIFTLIGCLSNFIIYLSTSQKLRNEIYNILNVRRITCKR